ncbi:MAG: hypothetical protein AYK19_08655 [Theionarchaea archaeon DG-70-1]|nr:MAG: hypothetical protein AYK19_08655 [Theionarchaea archaeon DG-70-1]
MRDKVLCQSWIEPKTASAKIVFFLNEKSYSLYSVHSLAFLAPDAVPVSVRDGEKMSLDEVVSFFDSNVAQRNQKARGFLEQGLEQNLDTISATESLFKGTVVDFNLGSHSGGETYANDSFAVN